jgi:hypothetical protein
MTKNQLFLNLTKRELESLENLVLTGSIKGAANLMNISARTMENYVEHLKIKLNLQHKCQFNKIFIENFYQRNQL